MDAETQDSLNHLENRLFHRKGADFMGIYEEFFHGHFFDENGAIDQFAFLKPDEEKPGNILLSKQDMEKVSMQAILVLVQKINRLKL
jgi:hypothetical protein